MSTLIIFYLILILISRHQCVAKVDNSLESSVSELADIKRYSFIASIVRARHGVCTGSLFTRQYVLTSAVCSLGYFDEITELPVPEDKSSFELRLKSDRVDSGGSLQTILHIYIHPNFRSVDTQTQYDLSIFKIVWIFILGTSLSLAPVHFLNSKRAESLMKKEMKCETVGWGYTELADSDKATTPALKRVDAILLAWEMCRPVNALIYSRNQMYCSIIPNKTCMLTRGTGSPLLCRDEVVGLASWGCRCSHDHQPLIFSRLDSWVMPFLRTRSAIRKSNYFSLSAKLEPPPILSLIVFVSYPIFLSIANKFCYFTKYIT